MSQKPTSVAGRWSLYRSLSCLLIFLGFVLRLYRIAHQSVWWDEAHAVRVARDGLVAVLRTPAGVSWTHPPLHYGLLTGWGLLAGFSELSIRYLSLLFGVLLLPVTCMVVRRLFDRPTALAAMTVAVLSPLYVAYSQEARVYVLLPLVYLLLLHALHQLTRTEASPSLGGWLGLGLLEALVFYSHFVLALGVLYVNLSLAITWLRRRRLAIGAWVGSQVLAAGLFMPWLWNMARYLDNIRPWIGIGEGEKGPSLPAFLWRVWQFTIAGNEAAASSYRSLAVGVALLALTSVLAVLLTSFIDDKRRQTLTVLAHGLVPLAFCFLFWQKWPLAHPRYTMGFSIPLFVVVGRSLVVLWNRGTWHRLLCVLFASALALALGTGLYVQYFVEVFHKDDVRGVAAYLERTTTAEDVILIGPDDYSVPYYYGGPATVAMARDEPLASKAHHLSKITTGKQRLFLVHWDPSKADVQGLRPFLLEQVGRLTDWCDFRGLDVRVYALDGATGGLPHLSGLGENPVRFGPLLLTGAFYEPVATTDNAVAVALRWRLVKPVDVAYKVVVMLVDSEGRRLFAADVTILDEAGRQTHRWPAGAETVNFYVVPVPVGAPAVRHRLVVGVYDADTLTRLPLMDARGQLTAEHDLVLGEVTLVAGRHFEGDAYGTWDGVDWEFPEQGMVAEGVFLERFAVSPRAVLPGGQMTVLLRWCAEGTHRLPVVPLLRLVHADEVWTEVGSPLLSGVYPPDGWAAGEVVVERRILTYPPRRGAAAVVLVVDDQLVSLGQVELDESALLWKPPPTAQSVGVQIGGFAELLGYDLRATQVAPGRPFRLTLYWQALNDTPLETSYTVFTQLLAADGHLIAQHDGPPAGNERPTMTWVGGEVIEDVHTLVFHDTVYAGPATLIVGLYDSATVTRLNTSQGQDHVTLPENIVVVVGSAGSK